MKKTVTLDLNLLEIQWQETSYLCLTTNTDTTKWCVNVFLEVLVFFIIYNTILHPESPFIAIN